MIYATSVVTLQQERYFRHDIYFIGADNISDAQKIANRLASNTMNRFNTAYGVYHFRSIAKVKGVNNGGKLFTLDNV